MGSARTVLDQVHSLAKIDELAREPGRYADAVDADLASLPTVPIDLGEGRERPPSIAAALPMLEARDHELAAALAHVDASLTRFMRVRLDHALAADTSADAAIPIPTRNVFASTLGKYAGDLGLLGQRVRDQAARGRARDPDAVAASVVDAARVTLELREALRAPVLELVRQHGKATLPLAEQAAMDRRRDDAERKRWSALRRDLELLSSRPDHVSSGPLAARLGTWDEQIDEPPAEAEASFADMIEMD